MIDGVATERDTIAYADTGGSLYACFHLILKMLSIGSPTTTCFKYSRDTALEMHLSLYEGATSIVQINGY